MNKAQSIAFPVPLRRLIYLRDLVRELVRRDIKAQYKSSALGVAWSLVNPLLQLLIFTFLFRIVLPLNIQNYPAFLFSGLLAWTWFQLSLVQATSAITSHRELIRRPGFPAAILPVITVTTNLANLLVALPLLFIFILLTGGKITPAVFVLPLVMILQFVLILAAAYFLAVLNVLFRDTQHLIGVVLQLLFFVTPVFYSDDRFPKKYQAILNLNPVAQIIGAYREILLRGIVPEPRILSWIAFISLLLLFAGYQLFQRMRNRFVEEL